MASYVKYELKDGTIVYIESTDAPKGPGGFLPAEKSKGEHPSEQTAQPFAAAVDAVSKLSVELVDGLRSQFEQVPDELSVNFGLKSSTDLNTLVISRGGMESNFSVSLRWHKPKPEAEAEEEKKDKESK